MSPQHFTKRVLLGLKAVSIHKITVPFLTLMRTYNMADLAWDANAGLVVGIMLIPQVS